MLDSSVGYFSSRLGSDPCTADSILAPRVRGRPLPSCEPPTFWCLFRVVDPRRLLSHPLAEQPTRSAVARRAQDCSAPRVGAGSTPCVTTPSPPLAPCACAAPERPYVHNAHEAHPHTHTTGVPRRTREMDPHTLAFPLRTCRPPSKPIPMAWATPDVRSGLLQRPFLPSQPTLTTTRVSR